MLQAAVDTYAWPVSAQALQVGPDRGHAVVENLERTSKLGIAAGTHQPTTCTLPFGDGEREACVSTGNLKVNDRQKQKNIMTPSYLLHLLFLAELSCSLRLRFSFRSEALTLFISSNSC